MHRKQKTSAEYIKNEICYLQMLDLGKKKRYQANMISIKQSENEILYIFFRF